MKTALSFLTIWYYQNKQAILICFLLDGNTVLLIYTIYLKTIFPYIKNTNRKISNIIVSFKQTLRDLILFLDVAGLDVNVEEWKQLCRKAWENGYDYLQIDSFA